MKVLKNKNIIMFTVVLGLLTACSVVKPMKNKSYSSFKKFNNDTLQYVKFNFYERKNLYIGKELNVLLSDFEMPVKSYTSHFLYNDLTGMSISVFESNIERMKNISTHKKSHNIIIVFEKSIPFENVSTMLRKNEGNWTKDEKEFFGKQIVKDIDLMDYDK